MEDRSWRQGFRALSAPSTAEMGEVLICVCTDGEYKEARREDRRAVGMTLPAKQITYLPPPPLSLVLPVRVSEEVECG
jgi:hypothetical protein